MEEKSVFFLNREMAHIFFFISSSNHRPSDIIFHYDLYKQDTS